MALGLGILSGLKVLFTSSLELLRFVPEDTYL